MPRAKQPRNIPRSRKLRGEMTLPETLLCNLLRNRPDGAKFRRQHSIERFVLDFYCVRAKVCIEVDGMAHDMGDRPARDAARDDWLKEQGIEVLRVPATDILASPENVAEDVVRTCKR